jgi:hypothetical protein
MGGMMAELPYVCLYSRYLLTLNPFTDAERGRIMMAMLTYSTSGEVPEFEGNERFIWPTIQAQIDRDAEAYQEKCTKNRVNGAKGGRPSKNQTVNPETERFSEKPKKANTKTNRNRNTNTKSISIMAENPPTYHQSVPLSTDQQRTPPDGHPFTSFWEAYPKKINREKAWQEWQKLNPSPEDAARILSTLEAWKKSGQWTEDGGRFIPDPANFLSKGYYNSTPSAAKKTEIPKGASGGLGAAELEAIHRILREDP